MIPQEDRAPSAPPAGSSSRAWLHSLGKALESTNQRVFSLQELHAFLDRERGPLSIPLSAGSAKIISLLVEAGKLHNILLQREGTSSPAGARRRFVTSTVSPYEVGLSLATGSYLSHASALFLHALTEQVPKTIYVNREQSPKPRGRGVLTQPAIDRAFRGSPRTSQYVFRSQSSRYVLLSGKHTDRLEVSQVSGPSGERLEATKLERTLIDVVVRPTYAGGVYEVARAYKAAVSRVSVNTLLAVLKKLDYVYPYHQSIGFLMERAGFSEAHLRKVENLGIRWDFYLDYRMQESEYDPRWHLHYPKGL